MNDDHPTTPLVWLCALRVLSEHAEGRSVDPSRLDWALALVSANPQRVPT